VILHNLAQSSCFSLVLCVQTVCLGHAINKAAWCKGYEGSAICEIMLRLINQLLTASKNASRADLLGSVLHL
jgi:hypothetical protein